MKRILVPLPSFDFDPTEIAVPAKLLMLAGHALVFATPDGKPGCADPRMATGKDMGLLKSVLMADHNGVTAYQELQGTSEFQNPIRWDQMVSKDYEGLLLGGGHAPGMRPYLESPLVQQMTVEFFAANRPVAAICHGTLVAARSISSATGKSVLWGRKTTCLTWSQEMLAWNLTRLWLGDYYRTYRGLTVQQEVIASLKDRLDFSAGPPPLRRDTPTDLKSGFVVRDGNYLSARWPGDAHKFGTEFVNILQN